MTWMAAGAVQTACRAALEERERAGGGESTSSASTAIRARSRSIRRRARSRTARRTSRSRSRRCASSSRSTSTSASPASSGSGRRRTSATRSSRTAVEGQIEGGTAQGLGLALMEEIQTRDGAITNASFTDYLIPTFLDMPPVVSELVEDPEPDAPVRRQGRGRAADGRLHRGDRRGAPRCDRPRARSRSRSPRRHRRALSTSEEEPRGPSLSPTRMDREQLLAELRRAAPCTMRPDWATCTRCRCTVTAACARCTLRGLDARRPGPRPAASPAPRRSRGGDRRDDGESGDDCSDGGDALHGVLPSRPIRHVPTLGAPRAPCRSRARRCECHRRDTDLRVVEWPLLADLPPEDVRRAALDRPPADVRAGRGRLPPRRSRPTRCTSSSAGASARACSRRSATACSSTCSGRARASASSRSSSRTRGARRRSRRSRTARRGRSSATTSRSCSASTRA